MKNPDIQIKHFFGNTIQEGCQICRASILYSPPYAKVQDSMYYFYKNIQHWKGEYKQGLLSILYKNDKPIGACLYERNMFSVLEKQPSCFQMRQELYFQCFVRKNQRRMGYGKMLLKECVAQAIQLGILKKHHTYSLVGGCTDLGDKLFNHIRPILKDLFEEVGAISEISINEFHAVPCFNFNIDFNINANKSKYENLQEIA